MTNKQFVHLHVHSEYSMLDGHGQIDRLTRRAAELKMPALAITDHGVLHGAYDFYKACKKVGIKPIVGMEGYMATRTMLDKDAKLDHKPYHFLLLARNDNGYKNLMRLSSEAYLKGFYYKPRFDIDLLAQHADGLIATSGCLASHIPSLVLKGNEVAAQQAAYDYQDMFGKGNYYLELQHHDIPEQRQLNKWLVAFSRTSGIPLVVTQDSHYVLSNDYDAHDTLLCVQTNAKKSETNRMRFGDNSYYLTEINELLVPFGEVEDALWNTFTVSELCEPISLLEKQSYHLPPADLLPEMNAQQTLEYYADAGLQRRFEVVSDETRQRLVYELDVINKTGFASYFLIVADLCNYARANDIWWNVRGSGAASLVAYSLGITAIDPLKHQLIFERFLNPDRVTMPDIDLDFQDDRRNEMIAYAVSKYGASNVAAIATFGTLGARSAIRDVGRALDYDLTLVNQVCSYLPLGAKSVTIEEAVAQNAEFKQLVDSDARVSKLVDSAVPVQGIARHASTHAAGIIISDKPLVEYVPLMRVSGKSYDGTGLTQVTQFPMETCEAMGLLKIDFLGLSTLAILKRVCEFVERRHGDHWTIDTIPYCHDNNSFNNELLDNAFKLIAQGNTAGVFQLEGDGMTGMLTKMRPFRFEHIVAAVALYRPGPMAHIGDYIRRLHGEEAITYRHPSLEPILKETMGIIVYQESIIRIASELFGYSKGEADLIRKAVSKKVKADLEKHRERFLEAGPKKDPTLTPMIVEDIFSDIMYFANYGFNLAHASDYAKVAVQTAVMKAAYPIEYMLALLQTYKENPDRLTHFLDECRRTGIKLLPPEINKSNIDFVIEDNNAIRFGLNTIKNVGLEPSQIIVSERLKNGPYVSWGDFANRVTGRALNKRVLESLAKAGAFQAWGKREQVLAAIEPLKKSIETRGKQLAKAAKKSQGDWSSSLFDLENFTEQKIWIECLPTDMEVDAVDENVYLEWEKELLSAYITARPTDKYIERFLEYGTFPIRLFAVRDEDSTDSFVMGRVGGQVTEIRHIITKKGDPMAFASLTDWHLDGTTMRLVLFPKTWKKYGHLVQVGAIVIASGKLDRQSQDLSLLVDDILDIESIY